MAVRRHKEAIHSGHFMVSNFEADEQDEEDLVGVPVPSEDANTEKVPDAAVQEKVQNQFTSLVNLLNTSTVPDLQQSNSLMIDVSLTKLFQCMSIAYRQKLTSPKWNRFLGMKLRWKDKFRLNNVIWRCWHMQFIKGHRKLVCAFANPMELDNHNNTEAGAILEGKYWKRKMNTILAGYKKWRIFYKNQHSWPQGSHALTDFSTSIESVMKTGKDDIELESLMTDHDFFVDALFNSLGSQSQHLLDNERILTNSEFLQPSLNNLGPNIEDLMDLDPIAPLENWLSTKLPETVDDTSVVYQVQNIKDIEVNEARYHPFSHATLRDVSGYGGGNKAGSQGSNNMGAVSFVAPSDSQPSTSTLSQYPEYVKKKAPLPGKKILAWQQQQQEQEQQRQMQQQASVISQQQVQPHFPQQQRQDSNTCHVTQGRPGHVSVIQNSQHVYQRSVIQSAPAMSMVKPAPLVPESPAATYTPSYLTPRPQQHSFVGVGASHVTAPVPVLKRENSDLAQAQPQHNSELVQLLRNTQKKSKTEVVDSRRPVRTSRGQTRKHKCQDAAEDLSKISGKHKKVVAMASIPPPPSSGLPQPQPSDGDQGSLSIITEDAKLATAEHKRRCTIKNGFEFLRTLLPSLSQTPNVKISKAALLAKGAEHVEELSREKEELGREVEQLKRSVEELNKDIAQYQLQLPTAGSAKVRTGSESDHLQVLFDKHVAACTMQNWKYFVFSKLMHPLLESFDRTVSSSSIEDLARTSGSWLDQHASLVQLRPLVLNSLKELSVNTEILSEPHRMPQEALNHVQNIIAPKKEFPPRDNLGFYDS